MKLDKHYTTFVKQIKLDILNARIKASRAINKELIKLYWNIGKKIVESQDEYGWGESVVETLSKDIKKELGDIAGFSARNLWEMRKVYLAYRDYEILQQLVAEISWGHHLLILNKTESVEEREFYIKSTIKLGWSRNVLLNQIKAKAYKRQLSKNKQHNFKTALPSHLNEQAEETLKSSYNLDFLGIESPILERRLENKLVDQIKKFILELGYGFCFISNQHKLSLKHKDYYVDLLFYHRKLKCLVAIDLKVGEFQPEYAGKMNFYLNLLDEQEKDADENPSIGIILCAEKNHIEVEYALKGINKPIGVSEYQLTNKLPKQYKGELPSVSELREQMAPQLIRPKK
jgi:predicted nuclease of restriction endonuclease-like (RecB) superfamily